MNPWNDIEAEVARRRLIEPLPATTDGDGPSGSMPKGAELYLIGAGADRTRARVFRDQDGNPVVTHVHDRETGGWRKLGGGEFERVRENFAALRSGAMSLTSVIQAQPQQSQQEATGQASGAERRRDIEAGMPGVRVQQGMPPVHGEPPSMGSGSPPQTHRDRTYEEWMGIHPASTLNVVEMGHGKNKQHLLEEDPAMPLADEDAGGDGGGGRGTWNGVVWLHGDMIRDYSEYEDWPGGVITGRYVCVTHATGELSFHDEHGGDNHLYSWHLVADKDNAGNYTLNDGTAGPIRVEFSPFIFGS